MIKLSILASGKSVLFAWIWTWLFCTTTPTFALTPEELRAARLAVKPWFLRNIEISENFTLPFTPVSVLVLFLSLAYLITGCMRVTGKQAYCEASHILLTDQSQASKDKLLAFQKEINNDLTLFAKFAKKHSSCPSGKSHGGMLGKFGRGDMTPAFDRLCFNPETPVGQTVGPIQTNFGWHLIYIHARELPVDPTVA